MSEQKLVSPLLDGFVMGNPMSTHDGIRCCPAVKENTDEKYIVKIISVPASQVQLDALLLTGACKDPAEAMDYFREVADSIVAEAELLNTLAKLDGFLPYEGWQIVPMEEGNLGYDVYLLSTYKRTLQRYTRRNPVTHLEAVNLGLDLCASLAISRRAGHLYVDLKPSNVFLSREKQYRIGDLGFVKLDSLEYTSLPGKYRSPYSPPEVQDDLKTLNETADTYSVGMILYQIYNEGSLPVPPRDPKEPFPHPANADYEISAIIMKALDPDPAKRWANPMEMGQALVGYMQRNTVNNVPIVPPSGILSESETSVSVPAARETAESGPAEPEPVKDPQPEGQETIDAAAPDTAPAAEPVPEESSAEAKADENPPQEDEDDLDFSIAFSDAPSAPEEPSAAEPTAPNPVPADPERKHPGKTILTVILILSILSCIACGAFWFYQTHYLKTIDNLTVAGSQHELTVTVDADMDTSLLQVTCTDAYGNSVIKDVVNGQAVFTDLLPDSLYRIEVTSTGFHELTGKTADIFTTDAITSVVSMSAIAGPEDGSVIVNFTVDGDDPDEWVITCSADGEEDIVMNFTGHAVTVKGMAVNKLYTLTLGSANGDQILGENTLDFYATRLIMAENLEIFDCTDGTMTVRWDAPEDIAVEKWNVRCYNDDGHEEVLEIGGTEIAFTGIDSTKAYTVEVTAEGMTQSSRISITAHPLTITDVDVHVDNENQIIVDWTHDGKAPEDGWLLMYSLDGIADQSGVVKCSDPSAVVSPRIPGAEYTFVIQAADSTSIFNNIHRFTAPDVGLFSNQDLHADKVSAKTVKTPEEDEWTIESIGEDAVTDSFQPGDSISVVLNASCSFYLPEMDIDVMYVIRNSNGNVLSRFTSQETVDWKALWYDDNYHNGELTLPKVPEEPGAYSVSIYFNHLFMASADFIITE